MEIVLLNFMKSSYLVSVSIHLFPSLSFSLTASFSVFVFLSLSLSVTLFLNFLSTLPFLSSVPPPHHPIRLVSYLNMTVTQKTL